MTENYRVPICRSIGGDEGGGGREREGGGKRARPQLKENRVFLIKTERT